MILTARQLVQKLANEINIEYSDVLSLVQNKLKAGNDIVFTVQSIAKEHGVPVNDLYISPIDVYNEILKYLNYSMSQTLLISAVLGQMADTSAPPKIPHPAFFAFLEILKSASPSKKHSADEDNIDQIITQLIELLTTLVSLICKWDSKGIAGVSESCPASLKDIAKTVVRKTKLLEAGMWVCIRCESIVSIDSVKGLLCEKCASEIYSDDVPFEDFDDVDFDYNERVFTQSSFNSRFFD